MYVKRTDMYKKHTLLSAPEVEVLEVFLDFQRHYFAELVKITKLTRPRTLRTLRKLVEQDLLEVKPEANVKYYSLLKSPLVCAVLSSVEYRRTKDFLGRHKTLKRAVEMLKEKYNNCLVLIIFGSVVKGYATKDSDIDFLFIKEAFSKNEIKKVEDVVDLVNGRIGLKISPYFMKAEEFKKRNELAKEVIDKHLLIYGGELFFRMVLENQRFSEPPKMEIFEGLWNDRKTGKMAALDGRPESTGS